VFDLPTDKRITILVGEFGSGKTELAIHHALRLAAQGIKTAIVDIDIVKPYFRTRESRELLEASGVYVVAPEQRLAHADLPILPQGLTRILSDTSYQVVMDVGGGDSSIVLGQIRPQLAETGYEALLVVNTRRPFTADSDGIIRALRRIEQVSRLTVTGLVANTNLATETTTEHILAGLELVKQAAERLKLPVRGLVAPLWLKDKIQADVPLIWLNPRTRYPWME
jgi:hypothetical protein